MFIDLLAKQMFNTIIGEMVNSSSSPYQTMMKKTKDIDIDYFEKIDRGVYTISDELNIELKDKVVASFSKMADDYYKDAELETRYVDRIREQADKILATGDTKGCKDFLNGVAGQLEVFVNSSVIHEGFPKRTNAEIEAMYQDARHITLKEFLLGTNDEDILNFYNALMDNTWWACREVVVRKTNAFLMSIAEKVRAMMPE